MTITENSLDATFAALADPTRRAILARLARGQASVLELAKPFQLTQAAISKHLKVLERAGLISRGKEAQRRPSRLEGQRLKQAADWLGTYREFWEESYSRLDDYLRELQAKPKDETKDRNKEKSRERKELEIIAEPGKTTFSTRRVVDAPRELVFDAFTKAEHVQRWMGPRALTMVSCESDLRVGGQWRNHYRAPDGTEFACFGEYQEIVRPERVVRTFSFSLMPGKVALETLTLEERDGKTTVIGVTEHKTVADRDGHLGSGMENGLIEAYARLDELLVSLS